ncbi:MAG: cytochrome c [Bauldia sp.]|nr:cytochrome c [Bauldia sp.]MCW5717921.1 cytochrome c [Bauldia sp.]
MRKAVIIGGAAGLALLSSAVVAQVTAPTAEVMTAGQRGFAQNCAVCHGAEGGGGAGPSLAGNPVTASSLGVVQIIIQGYLNHGMPPFGHLSDDLIAAIASYVRNSWGNAHGEVTVATVASIRADIAAAGPGE